MSELRQVGRPLRKKDAMQLVTGQGVYTADLAPKDCLVVKLKRSPHANARIVSVDKTAALRVPGVEAVFTWEDVDQSARRYTQAGQTFPEPSPYDRLLLDRQVRFAGDVAAIVAARDEESAEKALGLLRIQYEVLPAVLDFRTARDNPVLVHPEENWEALCDVGADNRRNLCAHDECGQGDIEAALSGCDVVVDRTYHTVACQQTMMETFRTLCTIDAHGRLDIVSSTQIVFHVRRIVSNALHIPAGSIRVRSARLGGGFGAKQTAVSEVYPAFVTWRLKKPSMLVFSRRESLTASSPRHEMELHVRLGAMRDGSIRGIDLYTLSNTGAYGEHGPTTVGLSGHKPIPLYGKAEAFRFVSDVVYTNHMSAGAYRGYGATQGIFAVESAVNELAAELGMDPIALREMNIVREGDVMPAYYGETASSCALDRCLRRVREMIGWEEKYPARRLPDGKIRSVGAAIAMQGSGIAGVDVGGAALRLCDDGSYLLRIGAADMGTGCDTTMAQVAAEALCCETDAVQVLSADTDASPYDSGSYASSTAYVTGKAVEKCARRLREKLIARGAELLDLPPERAGLDGEGVYDAAAPERRIPLRTLGQQSQCGACESLEESVTHSSPVSPPPFMAGAVELETDPATGQARVVRFCGCVDCGTSLNPNLTRVQTEGGVLQGIGMALTENVRYTSRGAPVENSLLQYRIPARTDVGEIQIDFAPSYEPSGPFGAKSIGEVVINTPGPAIADALFHAVGRRFYELPVTPEQIARGPDGDFSDAKRQ